MIYLLQQEGYPGERNWFASLFVFTGRKAKVLALSFGKALSGVVTLASFSALSYMLPEKEDYAAFRQTIMAFMIATPFMTMGLNQGLYYFLPTEKSRSRGRVFDALIIVGTAALIFGGFLFFGGNDIMARRFSNPQVASLLLLAIPLCLAHSVTQLFAPILTILERIFSLTIFNIVSRVLIGILTIGPVLIWVNPSAPLIGMTIGSGITCLAGLALVFWYLPRDEWKPRPDAIKEMLRFSIPLGVGGMIGALNLQMDKLIVSSMCTPDEFAVFANGAVEIPLIGVLTGSIVAVLMVDMRVAVSENRHQDALELFRKTAVQTSYVLFPVAIFLMIFADSFVSVLFSSRYEDAATPLRLYLLLIPVRTVTFGALLVALGLNKVILFRALVTLILNLALSAILVLVMGPTGAAVATVIIVFAWAVPCSIYFIARSMGTDWWNVMPFRHFGVVLMKLIMFAVCLTLLAFATKQCSSIVQLAFAIPVAGLWMLFWWSGKLYDVSSLKRKFRIQ